MPVLRAAHSEGLREVSPLCHVAALDEALDSEGSRPPSPMTTLALFAVAALTFSILAGVIEGFWARRARRRFQRKTSPVLHPLTHHGLRRVRHAPSWRPLHHVGLFLGFLLVTYVGLLLLRGVHSFVASWF